MNVSSFLAQSSACACLRPLFPRPLRVAITCAVVALGLETSIGAHAQTAATARAAHPQSVQFSTLGIVFEPNEGQNASISQDYAAQYVGLEPGLPEFALDFAGAKTASLAGVDALSGTNSYFPGSDPQSWRANVPTYPRGELPRDFQGS